MKLFDIDKEVDGLTQDDLIQSRKAEQTIILNAASNGNPICAMTVMMELQAHRSGLNMNYSEEVEEGEL